MADYRKFNQADWYAWAGCERFKTGSEPLIYEQDMNDGLIGLTIIAHGTGVSIVLISNEDDEISGWLLSKELTSTRAEGELRALINKVQTYTYAPDLAYDIDHELEPEFKGFEVTL